MNVSIIKPGFKLKGDFLYDYTYFGGLYEIYGLIMDLNELGFNIELNYLNINTEIVFIFPSGNTDSLILKELKKFKKKKIQCITDLNLVYSKAQIGYFRELNQLSNSEKYFPFEKYIYKFVKYNPRLFNYENWNKRQNNIIYAGGTREKKRDNYFKKYLINCDAVDTIYSSSSLLINLARAKGKIEHYRLIDIYRDTKFGLVLADDVYNSNFMYTQRPHEYLLTGMIPLFDKNYTVPKEFNKYYNIDSCSDIYQKLKEINELEYDELSFNNKNLCISYIEEMKNSHKILKKLI